MPAQAAMMSDELCVWKMPSWPEIQHATDGMLRSMVHEAKRTAPISSGFLPALASAPGTDTSDSIFGRILNAFFTCTGGYFFTGCFASGESTGARRTWPPER